MPPQHSIHLRRRPVRIENEIRRYRLQAGLTQSALAGALGVRTSTVSDWEGGLSCPALQLGARLATLLQAPIQALYPGVFFPLGKVDLTPRVA